MPSIHRFLLLLALAFLLQFDLIGAQYPVTHFVDINGVHHRTSSPAYIDYFRRFRCPRQGFYRHPTGCTRFYRCVQYDQTRPRFTVFEFDCPVGLVFDERHQTCNWPSTAPSCAGSSEILSTPILNFRCPREGFFRDPRNCRFFYKCVDLEANGKMTAFEFKCPYDLVFDEIKLICNWKWATTPCNTHRFLPAPISGQTLARSVPQPTTTNQLAIRDRQQMSNVTSRTGLNVNNASNGSEQTPLPIYKLISDFSSNTNDDSNGQNPLVTTAKDEELLDYLLNNTNEKPQTSGLNSQRKVELPQNSAGAELGGTNEHSKRPSGTPPFVMNQQPNTMNGPSMPPPPPPDANGLNWISHSHYPSKPNYYVQPDIPSLHVSYFIPSPSTTPSYFPSQLAPNPAFPAHYPYGYGVKSQTFYLARPMMKQKEKVYVLPQTTLSGITASSAASTSRTVVPSSNLTPKPTVFGSRAFVTENEPTGARNAMTCERAGLFRHPGDCNRFYECYWDRWLNKYTVHYFQCPVRLVYDESISGCNWPVLGPTCS